MKRRHLLALAAAPWPLLAPDAVRAQAAGSNLVVVVPFPAGGISDAFARALGPGLARHLGRNVIVDNVAGASGSIGAARVLARGAAGDTLFLGSPTELILAPATLKAVKYKPADFRLAGLISRTPLACYVRAELPVKTIDELIGHARANADKPLTYGSVGIGSVLHLATESFRDAAGVKLVHVPYRGGMPMLQDLQAGTLDMAFFPADGNIAKLVAGGKMRAIGITGSRPAAAFPGVATFADSKLLRGWSTVDVWAGVQLPTATPEPVVQSVHGAVQAAMADAEIRRQLETVAGGPLQSPMSLPELAAFYAAESARYATALKQANVDAS